MWFDDAIFWHVYPLGFCGAPIRDAGPVESRPVEHRLRRLLNWLDYAIELGASGLLLGPVFASTSHGYDTVDYLSVDPRLGDDADLDELIRAAHERGLRVVLDGVFNHVAWEHPLVQQAIAEGPQSVAARSFHIDYTDTEHPMPAVFEGHPGMIELNHEAPEVADLVSAVMRHWLARGVDGWRLDAAYAVPLAFWERVLPGVRADFPDAWFVGEVIHGDYPAFVDAGMDSVTQYELWQAIWSSIKNANGFELDWTLKRHNELLERFVPQTFIGNHDVTRIASQVGQAGAALAAVILFTVGGIPSIWSGDEQGFTGVKTDRVGGDDEVRPAFPDHPDELATVGAWMLRLYQDLIGIRRRHRWLTRASTRVVELTNERIRYVSEAGGQAITVEIEIAPTPRARISENGRELFSYPR